MIAPIQRDSLRRRVVRSLFAAIVKGELKPGERIVEGNVARQMGVALSTLREALQELEYQGLVTKNDNRGTFVTTISLKELDHLYTVRLQLEPLAASLAHRRMTPESHAQLRTLLEKMQVAADQRDFVELAQVDLEFHQTIWRLSGNGWLERALRLVGPPLLAFDYVGLYAAPTYDFVLAHHQHERLLEALTTGTPEDAKRFFEQMIETFRLQDIRNMEAIGLTAPSSSIPSSDGNGELQRIPHSRAECH